MSESGVGSSESPPPPATSTLAPEMGPDAKIRFIDAHRPKMLSGDYMVEVNQPIGTYSSVQSDTVTFRVAGPRFTLDPTDIHSAFPPPGARGRFGRVLPHVVLERSSLAWERTAIATASETSPTWLAVVIVDAATERLRVSTLETLRRSATHPPLAARSAETADNLDEKIRVLTVRSSQLPSFDDLPWQTHVRSVDSVSGPVETAIVVADRVPEPGVRHRAHLVSIEGLYDGRVTALTPSALAANTDDVDIDVVALYSWDFVSQDDDHHGFVEMLNRLSVGDLRTAAPEGTESGADFFSVGWVPLDHHLRQGDDVTSWYHSPLSVGGAAMTARLPVQRSDHLVVYEERSGMLDVSYAAGWELGRLLALQNPRIGQGINTWKRAKGHHDRHAEQRDALRDLPQLHPSPRPSPSFDFGDWFTVQLNRLTAVPFRYLVPDEAMLPSESLRFFEVDDEWIRCLFDGAFSMGRRSEAHVAADEDLSGSLPDIEVLSGILLRSDVVTLYPGMMIDVAGNPWSPQVQTVRIDHLAPDVLLVLVTGWIRSVTLHLHPQVLHFGFDDAQPPPANPVSLAGVASERQLQHSGLLAESLVARTPRVRFVRGAKP